MRGRAVRTPGADRRTPAGRAAVRAATLAAAVLSLAACDDQIKYVPIFSAMTEQPSIEAFEAEPRGRVPGTMPVDGERSLDLLAADTALSNPLAATAEEVARGGLRFREFCTPCHGPQGRGDGPVVGPNRIPPVPMLDLHTDRAIAFSDGYMWGMITNGRGVMPSYRRIPPDDRWRIVLFVRALQAGAAVPPVATAGRTATPGGRTATPGGRTATPAGAAAATDGRAGGRVEGAGTRDGEDVVAGGGR